MSSKHHHWIWGVYICVEFLDVAAAAIGLSTSSWINVALMPHAKGQCTVEASKAGSLSSGLLSSSICSYSDSDVCADMLIVMASLGYSYVLLKLIALIIALVVTQRPAIVDGVNHQAASIRVQACFQLVCFIISMCVVLFWGVYISNFIGIQFVGWSCSAWSFYLFCGGAAVGLFSFVGILISFAYRSHHGSADMVETKPLLVQKPAPTPPRILKPVAASLPIPINSVPDTSGAPAWTESRSTRDVSQPQVKSRRSPPPQPDPPAVAETSIPTLPVVPVPLNIVPIPPMIKRT